MKTIEIVIRLYDALIRKLKADKIPLRLKPHTVIGTVQDDPFDCWMGDTIKKALPDIEVHHAGKLTTPGHHSERQGKQYHCRIRSKKTDSEAERCGSERHDH